MSTYLRYDLRKFLDRCKIATVDIAKIFKDQLARCGRRAAEVSKEATGQKDAIKRILDGHVPSINRAEKIARALGLEFYIGPPRQAKSDKTPPSFYTFEDSGKAAPRRAPARDRQLAEVLAALAEHYERSNEYGKQFFIEEVKARWPALFKAGAAAETGGRLVGLGGSAGGGGAQER